MRFLNNINISKKLTGGFGLILLVLLIMAIYGFFGISSIANGYERILDSPNRQWTSLKNIESNIINLRYQILMSTLYQGNEELINDLERNVQGLRDEFSVQFNELHGLLEADQTPNQEIRLSRETEVKRLEELVYSYIDNIAMPVFQAIKENDLSLGLSIISAGASTRANMNSGFISIQEEIEAYMASARSSIQSELRTTEITFVAASVLALALSVLISYALTVNIAKPIRAVTSIIKDIAKGRANHNKHFSGQDEVGMLGQSAELMSKTIKNLTSSLEKVCQEHISGIDSNMDETKFAGEYRVLAQKINEMINFELSLQKDVMSVFEEIANGNFEVEVPVLPGDKAKITETTNRIKRRILAVADEINMLIHAAAIEGDLAVHIDSSKFKGDWEKVLEGLNKLAKSVDAPVVEIRDVMERFGRGDFEARVTGNYPGDFLSIKNSVNKTVENIGLYTHEIGAAIESLSGGDLTSKIDKEFVGDFNAIKNSINAIAQTMNKTMSEISAASSQVLSGAKQISQSAMDLATGATEQASSVQELTATLEVINHQTVANAENSEEANILSDKSSSSASEGANAMKQMLLSMSSIKESSASISRIIKVIQEIAFQTNLLSLNAAVEAARAGDHGKGFTVVSEEVRALATKSQEAAKNTTDLIEESIERVDVGSETAKTTANVLDVIVKNALETQNIINQIAQASREQAEAIQQVSQGLGEISKVVQINSSTSEETAAAAQELNSQAEVLQQMVGFFKLN